MSRGEQLATRGVACLVLAFVVQLVALASPASAEKTLCPPYPCYHTAQGVLNWKPSSVKPYDVAGVPLARTARTPAPGMLVGLDNGAWSYWNKGDLNAQGTDARGNIYKLSQWPYVDRLYYYSHNLLSVPPTVWTNAAHRQGVKVLGTVTGDCLKPDCEPQQHKLFAQYPNQTVKQLQKIAAAYGFDGWVIDIEEDQNFTPNLLKAMSDLSKLRLPNGARIEVAFYYAGHQSIDPKTYQGLKAAGHFQSDYTEKHAGAVDDPKQSYDFLKAHHDLGLLDDSYYSTYVYNYETENNDDCHGHTSATLLWNGQRCLERKLLFANQGSALAPENPPGRYQAPSLFAPAWTMFGGLDKVTDKLPSRGEFERTDAALWRGPGFVDRNGRCVPSDPSANAVSSQVAVRPAIAQVPFVTRFDTGEGSSFSAQGRVVHDGGWNLLSAQDALPVAWCGEGSTLNAGLDYGEAFDGGSSLRVSGTARDGSRRVFLYAARAQLPDNAGFLVRYGTGGGVAPRVTVSLAGVKGPVDLRTHRVSRHGQWVLARAKLPSRFAPATLTRVGVAFGADGDPATTVDRHLGELRVVDRDTLDRPARIGPTRRRNSLSWDPSPGSVLYYNVWAAHRARSCLRFVGRTQIERYDLGHPLFDTGKAAQRYEVQPVNASGGAAKLSGPRCRPGG